MTEQKMETGKKGNLFFISMFLMLLVTIGLLFFLIYFITTNQPPRQTITPTLPSNQTSSHTIEDQLDRQITPIPIHTKQDLTTSITNLTNDNVSAINLQVQELEKTASKFNH